MNDIELRDALYRLAVSGDGDHRSIVSMEKDGLVETDHRGVVTLTHKGQMILRTTLRVYPMSRDRLAVVQREELDPYEAMTPDYPKEQGHWRLTGPPVTLGNDGSFRVCAFYWERIG